MSIYANSFPHENRVDNFFLTHIQCPEIINSDFIFALSEYSGLFWYPRLFHIEKVISLNSILMLPIAFHTQ